MPTLTEPRPFGDYLLLDLIAVGGTAEVFRAATLGVAGFQRLIAIKRILADRAADKLLIDMLIDEAQIAVQLTDPNIVQVFELGEAEERYYIAMEYVSGPDLRYFMTRLIQEKAAMPVPVAAYIVSKVCSALDYAHRKKGADGENLNIIHRDVSPHNVLIGYDGAVKVTDFGIAKAEHRLSQTAVGTIKGKFSYMAPEQVMDDDLDNRADIFSAGIILHELLTGARLFSAPSDVQNLHAIRAGDIKPPRELRADIPESLEAVVMKALALRPEQRYRWASEMHDALQPFLIDDKSIFTAAKIRSYLDGYDHEALVAERQRVEALTRMVESYRPSPHPELAEQPVDGPTVVVTPPHRRTCTVIVAGQADPEIALALSGATLTAATRPAGPVTTSDFGSPTVVDARLQGLTAPTHPNGQLVPTPAKRPASDAQTVPLSVEAVKGAPAAGPRDTTVEPAPLDLATVVSSMVAPGLPRRGRAVGASVDPGFAQALTMPALRPPAPVPGPMASAEAAPLAASELPPEEVEPIAAEPAWRRWLAEHRVVWVTGIGAGAAVALIVVVVALWPDSKPVPRSVAAEVPVPASPPASPGAPDTAPPPPSSPTEPAADTAVLPETGDEGRTSLRAAQTGIGTRVRKLEIIPGDLPAVDQQRHRIATLIREERLAEAVKAADRVIADLDAVTIDKAFVTAKRERLQRLSKSIEGEAEQRQLAEALTAAATSIQEGDFHQANRHLNRGFKLTKVGPRGRERATPDAAP